MLTLSQLALTVYRDIERHAGLDTDVDGLKEDFRRILESVAPGCLPEREKDQDELRDEMFLRLVDRHFPESSDPLSRARDLFRRTTEPRTPFGFTTTKGYYSRKAQRLAYVVKRLAEFAAGAGTAADEMIPQRVQLPRPSPATQAPDPFQEGNLAKAVPPADLYSLAQEVDEELRDLDRLDHPEPS